MTGPSEQYRWHSLTLKTVIMNTIETTPRVKDFDQLGRDRRTFHLDEPTFNWLILEKDARFEDNYATEWIIAHMGFWNLEGAFVYASNLSKGYGSPDSRKNVLNNTFDQFLLQMIECDAEITCVSFLKETGREWTVIRLYSHVAIHNEYNERVALIRFNHEAYDTH